tara:strand:- start:1039 stop:1770 length:732 start_codon:yes stop_codon:yes gene_type:complete
MANFTVSSAVDTMMQSSDAAGIRSSIGVVDGVTSVSLTDGTGIASSGSPVTSSGSITVGLNAATQATLANSYPFTTDKIGSTVQTRNLTSITTGDGLQGQTLLAIYIGSNVTTIGSYAFSYGNFPNIIIPNTVTTIGSYAFAYASAAGGTANITLPTNLTAISDGLFRFSGVSSITIPASVTSIGSGAFYYCTSLGTVNCLATTAPTLGSNAFQQINTSSIHVPVGATGYGTTYGGLTVIADL